MNYVLESKAEFDRLDQQSNLPSYDYAEELSQFDLRPGEEVLDAGSGSGIVAHFLATQQSTAKVVGCDLSPDRVSRANDKYKDQKNLSFVQADLTKLKLNQRFDRILCRYVLSHFGQKASGDILKTFHQHLKPNGTLYIVDVDGLFLNLFPQSKFMADCLQKLGKSESPDLSFGRALPFLVHKSGFSQVQWNILTKSFDQSSSSSEMDMIASRVKNAKKFFEETLGSKKKVARFLTEYLSTLSQPGSVLFYNKFVVKSQKAGFSKLVPINSK